MRRWWIRRPESRRSTNPAAASPGPGGRQRSSRTACCPRLPGDHSHLPATDRRVALAADGPSRHSAGTPTAGRFAPASGRHPPSEQEPFMTATDYPGASPRAREFSPSPLAREGLGRGRRTEVSALAPSPPAPPPQGGRGGIHARPPRMDPQVPGHQATAPRAASVAAARAEPVTEAPAQDAGRAPRAPVHRPCDKRPDTSPASPCWWRLCSMRDTTKSMNTRTSGFSTRVLG